jgi:predicted DNA-binding protein (UPF0251 family)
MDKLFDGSDAHLLPGNAELIQRLRYERDDDERYEAADALEAAENRIAELEALLLAQPFRSEREKEAERKLAVAREALTNIYQQTQEGATHALATEALIAIRKEALAQIGGEDAS